MKMETLSSVIPLRALQSSLPFGMPDVSPMIRQVTLRREKPSCSREFQPRLTVPDGAIIQGQKSILLMACPFTISTNTPKAASGTRVSASSTSKVAAQVQHQRPRLQHRQRQRQLLQRRRRLSHRQRRGLRLHHGRVLQYLRGRKPQGLHAAFFGNSRSNSRVPEKP